MSNVSKLLVSHIPRFRDYLSSTWSLVSHIPRFRDYLSSTWSLVSHIPRFRDYLSSTWLLVSHIPRFRDYLSATWSLVSHIQRFCNFVLANYRGCVIKKKFICWFLCLPVFQIDISDKAKFFNFYKPTFGSTTKDLNPIGLASRSDVYWI